MKTTGKMIDGYALQNTAHVLCAMRSYEIKTAAGSRGDAERAAIDCYAGLSGKRVDCRTVRRWLSVIKSYGGIEQTPANAFGARKSCPRIKRPIRSELRQIVEQVARLNRELPRQEVDPRLAIEVAFIERDMEACLARVQNEPVRYPLESIRRLALRLSHMPINRLHQSVTAPELEKILTGISTRLCGVIVQCPGEGLQSP